MAHLLRPRISSSQLFHVFFNKLDADCGHLAWKRPHLQLHYVHSEHWPRLCGCETKKKYQLGWQSLTSPSFFPVSALVPTIFIPTFFTPIFITPLLLLGRIPLLRPFSFHLLMPRTKAGNATLLWPWWLPGHEGKSDVQESCHSSREEWFHIHIYIYIHNMYTYVHMYTLYVCMCIYVYIRVFVYMVYMVYMVYIVYIVYMYVYVWIYMCVWKLIMINMFGPLGWRWKMTDLGLMKSQLLKTPGAYPNCFGANPDCFLQNYGKNQRKPGFRW